MTLRRLNIAAAVRVLFTGISVPPSVCGLIIGNRLRTFNPVHHLCTDIFLARSSGPLLPSPVHGFEALPHSRYPRCQCMVLACGCCGRANRCAWRSSSTGRQSACPASDRSLDHRLAASLQQWREVMQAPPDSSVLDIHPA